MEKIPEQTRRAIYDLRLTGLKMNVIAERVGVSGATVSRTLAAMGDPSPHVWPEKKRCTIDGCGRLSNYGPHGYCRMHELREMNGQPMTPDLLRAPKGDPTKCIIEGCDRQRKSKLGYCDGHARRIKNSAAGRGRSADAFGPGFEPRTKLPRKCSFAGCAGKPKARGYCEAHLRQQRVYGRMVPVRTIFDECTYTAAHHRCRQLWGKVRQYPCIECGAPAEQWAYDGKDPTELYEDRKEALRSILPYSRFPEFYIPMCGSCHKKRDMEEIRRELEEFRAWRRKMRQSELPDDDPPPF
jgi:hypothetical protein